MIAGGCCFLLAGLSLQSPAADTLRRLAVEAKARPLAAREAVADAFTMGVHHWPPPDGIVAGNPAI